MKISGKLMRGLAVLVLVTGFFACSGKSSTSATTGPATDITLPGGWKPTADYSKPVNISIATVMVSDPQPDAKDEFAEWVETNFNMKVEGIRLTFDNWTERLRLWIASGDMPEVAIFDYNHADAANWVEEGLLKKMPDGWKERWPNLAHAFEITTLGPELERRHGGAYFLPRPRFDNNLPGYPLPNHISLWYRKDWTDAIGFPSKEGYTTSEVIDLARQIKRNDPGKLGSRLVPLTARPEFAMRLFVQNNSTHFNNFYKDTTGTYRWGPASPDTLVGLKLWYRAFAEGILDPEFFALKDQEDVNKFMSAGVAGSLNAEATGIYRWYYRELIFAPQTGNPPEALGVATVLGEDGYYHLEDLINYWGCYIFSPDLTDDEFYRILDNMDFFATDPGFLMSQLGFEGVDWEYKDGEYVSLVPEGTQLSDKYPRMGTAAVGIRLPDDFSFDNPSWPKQYGQENKEGYAYMIKNSTLDTLSPIDWDLYCYDSPVMRRARAYSFDQEFANLITRATSEANLEVIWNAWIQQQAPIIQPALNELNTNLKK